MLILRIKRAEVALADGRLDEAYHFACEEKLRAHRRGQDLAGNVARALVKRGQEHLDAGRIAQAAVDADHAIRLAGNCPDAAELRAKVIQINEAKQQDEKRKAEAVLLARRQIEMGQLSVGEGLLRQHFAHKECDGEAETRHGGNGCAVANHDGEIGNKAAALLQDVAARRAVVGSVLDKAEDALARGDWENAVTFLVRAREQRVADAHLGQLVTQVTRLLTDKTQNALKTGRLDLATLMVKRLEQIADRGVDTEQLHQAMDLCRTAWGRIERCELRRAEEAVRRLAVVFPGAKWIDESADNLRKAADAMDELRAGPFGLLDAGSGANHHATSPPPLQRAHWNPPSAPAKLHREHPAMPGQLPSRFVIQVDGIGSFLVLTGSRVSVGPVSGSTPVDLGLVAESNAPVFSVERQSSEADYFLRSASPVHVNEKPTTGRLLHTGDRIAASTKCRVTFRLPSAASTSAILDLHGARLMRGDVKRVILMDREILIGPGSGSHIRDDQMPEPAVLYVHDGKLLVRTKDSWTVDGKIADRSTTIAVGSHVKVGEVTFVVTAA